MKYEEVPLLVNNETNSFDFLVDGLRSFIDFKKRENIVYLIHTEVPTELEGQGIASAMVEKTLQYLDEHQLKLVPSCSYIRAYLKRNPGWNKLLNK